jgi:hypothetical protein
VVASVWGVVGTAIAVVLIAAWAGIWLRSLWWELRVYSEHTRIARDAPPRPDEERPDQNVKAGE